MVRGTEPPPLPVAGAVRHLRRSDDGRRRPKQRDDWETPKNHRRPLDTESARSQLSGRIVVSASVRSKGFSSPRYIFLFLRGNRGKHMLFPLFTEPPTASNTKQTRHRPNPRTPEQWGEQRQCAYAPFTTGSQTAIGPGFDAPPDRPSSCAGDTREFPRPALPHLATSRP